MTNKTQKNPFQNRKGFFYVLHFVSLSKHFLSMRFGIILALFFSLSLQSQTTQKNVFTLKPALGFNGCQIHGDNYSGYDKFGVLAGIAVNAALNEKMSLELGFYFSQKGSRHNQNPDKGDYSYYRVNLNYIDLPLSFRYMLNSKYFITAGSSIAYLINYSEDTQLGNWNGVYPFKKYEVGLNVGFGAQLKNNFSVELRSSNSVTPIRPYGITASGIYYPNAIARFFNKGLYNNILSVIISYQLDFKKQSGNQKT